MDVRLTDSASLGSYWRKLKERLKKEGNETVTNCHSLKLRAADTPIFHAARQSGVLL